MMRAIRSFLLDVRNRAGETVDTFLVPIEGAAYFINPLFSLLPDVRSSDLREPWYRLAPRSLSTGPLREPAFYPPRPQTNPPIEILADPGDRVRAITVTLFDLERELYQADYSTVDVFGPLLSYVMSVRIAGGRYSAADGPFYLMVTPQVERGDMQVFELLPEDAPVEGVFPLPTPRRRERRTRFEPVTQYSYEERSLDDFGALRLEKLELGGRRQLLWRRSAYADLLEQRRLSEQVEVGGFLVGQVYRDRDDAERLLVDVQQVLAAEATSASLALLRFTADSWSRLRRRMTSDMPGLRLLGWWHTHLFPASDSFGLSGLDETLHRLYFTSPWHFAALINLSYEQGRVLRCYQADEHGILRESTYAIMEET